MIDAYPPIGIGRDLSLSTSPFLEWIHATLRHVVEDSFEMRRLKLHPNIWSTRVFREGPLEELFYDGRTLQALDDIVMGDPKYIKYHLHYLHYLHVQIIFHFSFYFFRYTYGKILEGTIPPSPAILKNPCFKVWLACALPILARWTKRCDSNVQNGGSRLPRAAASLPSKKNALTCVHHSTVKY